MQIIANGLTTVPTHQLVDFLLNYVRQEEVERIIIGHPKQMNNEDSENMKNIIPFMNRLKKSCQIWLLNWWMSALRLF